jgi:hypothetical protein
MLKLTGWKLGKSPERTVESALPRASPEQLNAAIDTIRTESDRLNNIGLPGPASRYLPSGWEKARRAAGSTVQLTWVEFKLDGKDQGNADALFDLEGHARPGASVVIHEQVHQAKVDKTGGPFYGSGEPNWYPVGNDAKTVMELRGNDRVVLGIAQKLKGLK